MTTTLRHRRRPAPRRAARGFTLVEVMVAMAIAVFLLGGLLTIVQNTRKTFGNQNQMAQFQDNERLAMTIIGDVIQEAGYFPKPTANTASAALPVDAGWAFFTAGQPMTGTHQAAAPQDTINVRFLTGPSDGVINCTGNGNTNLPASGINVLYKNQFSIDANNNLVCSLNGAAPVVLVPGIQDMQIWYGVMANTGLGNGAIDTYLRSNQMNASNWMNVIAVKVILVFVNPLAGQPNQPATITLQRVVCVMNRCGVS